MTTDLRERDSGLLISAAAGATLELTERLAQLELALEDQQWINLGDRGNQEFSRGGLRTINQLARLMAIKNPLIKRGVKVAADYIYGRGINIQAADPEINVVVQRWLDDPRNQVEFTGHEAQLEKDRELRIDGNIFFCFFVHPTTGHVRIGSIPFDQITNIITNPQNRKETWYYLRTWQETSLNTSTGVETTIDRQAYYPDWRYRPETMLTKIGDIDVVNVPVYHVKIGGFSDWLFGVSEVYAAIDWSRAYVRFLENWSTIVAAYARFAFKVTAKGGSGAVASTKAKLATASGTNPVGNTTIPGSTAIVSNGADIDPIRTAGATTSASDGRHLKLMVAAAQDLPETFYGDVSTGNLATARTLDRPTELAFTNRQALWSSVYHAMIDYVIYHAVNAVDGPLNSLAQITQNEYAEDIVTFNEGIDPHVNVDFPSIVEHDLTAVIDAITKAAPFLPDPKLLARMVLVALGENDIDELLDMLFPEGSEDEPVAAPEDQPLPEDELLQTTEALRSAMKQFTELVTELRTVAI